MRIITPRLAPERPARLRAFTLVEVLVGSTLGAIVLAGVLSAFLFLGRAGVAVQNYSDMEAQAREAMETFALDVRMAYGVSWTISNGDATAVTVTVEENGGEARYTYTYDSGAGTFSRQRTFPSAGSVRLLISGIKRNAAVDFFTAYKIDTQRIDFSTTSAAAAANMTKQIQISLEAERLRTTLGAATNKVVSARFVLRNKKVTT